jgi:hypothetical protein
MSKQTVKNHALGALVGLAAFVSATNASADPRTQAAEMFKRLNGVPPTSERVDEMAALIGQGKYRDAAMAAINDPAGNFYQVIVRDMVAQWTNIDGSPRVGYNDMLATVIGMIRDGENFSHVLSDDIVYVADPDNEDVKKLRNNQGPRGYSLVDNNHYQDLQDGNIALSKVLVKKAQSELTPLVPSATAGLITTRTFGDAYFKAGTNRRAGRGVYKYFLCNDIAQLADTTRSDYRVRQDVARTPGGDPAVFTNTCKGCHAGQDPMAGAFAYYDFVDGQGLLYSAGQVQDKMVHNAYEFPQGYVTTNDGWVNLWAEGPNSKLGWKGPQTGNGAKSWGQMITAADAFADCMAKTVVAEVCNAKPEDSPEAAGLIRDLSAEFRDNGTYDMKKMFAGAAARCTTRD